jgi:leucine-rich repeat protein SHOC2
MFNLLPLEVIREILKVSEFKRLLLVSKQFNDLFDEILWEHFLERDYENRPLKLIGSNKDKYFKCYELTKFLLDKRIELPVDNISDLYNLQKLSLFDKQIVPKELFLLVNLRKLDLSFGQIKEMCGGVSLLVNLQYLDLRKNQIKEIPEELFSLANLQTLNLAYNEIKRIPKGISLLVNLQNLYLSNNQIESIPKGISSLVNLRFLHLHDNQIKEICEELSLLVNLQYLYLHDNQITKVCGKLSLLVNLRGLYLYSNQIKETQKELVHLKNNGVLII